MQRHAPVRRHLHRIAMVAACALAMLAGAVGSAFGVTYGWSPVTTPATQTITGVCFTSDNAGWIATQRGLVYHTDDGGSTWTTVPVGTTSNLKGVRFADAYTGWVTGDDGTIRFTDDGGTVWQTQTSGYTGSQGGPEVFDTQRAWIPMPGAGGLILRTTNAGTNWPAALTGTGESIKDVSFVDALNGWAVGTGAVNGALFRTTDGGVTWIPVSPAGTVHYMDSVAAVDSMTAFAVTTWGEILTTRNGGVSWDTTQSVSPSLYSIESRGGGELWTAGWDKVLHTRDSGVTWQEVASLGPVTIRDMSFPSEYTAYASGDSGVLFKYTAPVAPGPHSVEATDATAVEVTWTPSPDAAYYEYRYGSTEGTTTGTEISMPSPPFGDTTVRVRAITSEGLSSPWVAATVTNHELLLDAPVPGAAAVVDDDNVFVSWPAVQNATGYRYRLAGGSIAETTATGVTVSDLTLGDNHIEVQARSNRSESPWASIHVEYAIPQPQTISIGCTPFTLVYPATSVTVTGTTTGVPAGSAAHAATVTVDVRPYGGTLLTKAAVRSSASGVVPATAVGITGTSYVRLNSEGDAHWLAATSPEVKVYYKPSVSTPSVPKVRRNRKFTTTFKVYTPAANTSAVVTFTYYRKVSGHWKKITKLTASRGAWSSNRTVFTRSYTAKTAGKWKVTASYWGKGRYLDRVKTTYFTVN